MNNKKCRQKFSDTCMSRTTTDCVDYVGDLYPVNTSLDADDCNTATDIIEDIINILDQHTEALDFSEFGCCLEYEASNEEDGVTIKDVIRAHESMLCDHEDRISKLEKGESSSSCSDCKDCGEGCDDTDGCCTILKYYDSYTQPLAINQINWLNSTNSALQYKANKGGVYKITLELAETTSVLPNQQAFIGISLNGLEPDSDLYSQAKLAIRYPKTITFISKMKVNDTVRVAYKRGTTNYELEYVKMFVEKVK